MSAVTVTGGWDEGFLARFEDKLLTNMAEETRDSAKASMGNPGPNPPSNPGSAPNRQTSDLYNHIEAAKTGPHTAETTSTRPSGSSEVPGWLEYGTPGGRMKARPYMLPASEKTRVNLERIVRKSVREAK